MKRTLFFGNPYHLQTKNEQLVINNRDNGEIKTIPVEDLGFVVFEHPQLTFSQSVIRLLAKNNTAVIFCDDRYHPASMLLHLDTHYVQTERFRHQVNANEPLKKQIWQQIIKAKILNQAKTLEVIGQSADALLRMSKKVLSADTGNQEAQAARKYWPNLFGVDFKRERYGHGPNPALNYGYAILRAAVARALAGSGLLPAIGIHHRNRYNSFCLADDIMEPYRPMVDLMVFDMLGEDMDCDSLGKESKGRLLQLLTRDVSIDDQVSPLMVAVSKTTASLARCFEGKIRKLILPEVMNINLTNT